LAAPFLADAYATFRDAGNPPKSAMVVAANSTSDFQETAVKV
jgi:hypothetical protein